MKKIKIPFGLKIFIFLIAFLLMFILSLAFGAAEISLKSVWLAIISKETNDKILILREIRLPRELAAILVGAALAVAGAIMQGITRNPLADPGLLGLTSGANAALAITIAFIPRASYLGILFSCFLGAVIGVIIVLVICSSRRGGFSPMRIVLAGAAVSTLLHAIAEGIAIYFHISKDVSMWSSGGLLGVTWNQLQIIAPFIIVGIMIALFLSGKLTILSFSEEVAIGLGQRTAYTKALLYIVIILLAGSSVALAGNMVFIGLIIPHIVRAIIGSDYRYILPISVLLGSIMMLFADTLGRTINAPYETPVAAIIAILGLPFFLFLVRNGGKEI